MSDTIDRQAAIDAAIEAADECEWDGGYSPTRAEMIEESLKKLPPAQPERKTGKWIRNDNDTYSCSVCQSWIRKEQRYYARYCLYCGARMENV